MPDAKDTPPDDRRTDWRRISEAFTRAAELTGEGRERFLSELARASPGVHRQVLELLDADRRPHPGLTGGGMPGLPVDPRGGRDGGGAGVAGGAGDGEEEADDRVGLRVGPYVIDGFLARGGMGAVYSAVRAEGGFRQEVAIKLLDRAHTGPSVMRRFESERAILAGLEHPSIARLLDGGTTPDGIPWFAMERVRGSSLTDHARQRGLGLEARLELMIRICEAVDFAHRNLVVHRDLKPGNIMVTDEGSPKLLDFGIAKVLQEDVAGDPAVTHAGARVLTPAYASPEQVDGSPVTTATDTYALGLLLYELLTDTRPWPTSSTDAELRQAILTAAPPPPSRAPREGRPAPVDPARVRGDLDLICLKALRKEPERRYPTAAALADDLRGFLEGRPVSARPDSFGYRASRWMGRNRALAGVAGAALLVVIASTVFYTLNLRAERDRARTQEARAAAALEFVTQLFQQSDPSIERTDTTAVGTFLDRGLAEIRARGVDGSPDGRAVQATLLSTLGDVYYHLGRIPRADSLLSEAIALREADLGEAAAATDGELAAMRFSLGRVRQGAGALDSAAELQEAALRSRTAELGGDDPRVGEVLRSLAQLTITRADLDSAQVLAERALEVHQRDPGPGTVDFAESEAALARVLSELGDYPAARPLYESALATLEREVGETDPRYLEQLFLFADMQSDGGFESEAESNYLRLIELETRIYGRRHPRTATGIFSLGQLYTMTGRDAEARPLIEEVLDIRMEALGERHYQVATTYNALGRLAEERGDYAESERYFRLALETSRYGLGEDHRNRVINLINLSRAVGQQGDLDESLRLVEEAEAMVNRLGEPPNRDWADVMFAKASLFGVMRRYEDAVEVYQQLIPYRRETQGPESTYFLGTLYGYGLILDRLGRWDEVLPIYEEVAGGYRPILGDSSWQMTRVDADLARAQMWTAYLEGEQLVPDRRAELRGRLTAWVDTIAARFGTSDRTYGQATDAVAVFDSLFGS